MFDNKVQLLFAVVVAVQLITLQIPFVIRNQQSIRRPSTSWSVYHERCDWILTSTSSLAKNAPRPFIEKPLGKNPRVSGINSRTCIYIKNATVWDGLGGELPAGSNILLAEGIIQCAGKDCAPERLINTTCRIIEVNGQIVTPGLVDVHSHGGLSTWPALHGNDDVNEVSSPLNSQMRSLDAFSLHDHSFHLVTTGGVTSSLVLPGSANLMGGEAFVFKHLRSANNSVEEMRIEYGMNNDRPLDWRWMKMALGENPKRVHGSRSGGTGPVTRMGNSFQIRQRLSRAQLKLYQLQSWCLQRNSNINFDLWNDFLELESLLALLLGQVRLNVHVYETHDIETLLRISHEFNISISAIHHATSAHLLASRLKHERETNPLNRNLAAAIFVDKGYYKAEAYYASTDAPRILLDHGIPFAFKSDHSVTNAQFLAWHAAKSVYYGLKPQEALKAITSVPASILGLSSRIGSIRPGMDADIVIWDGGSPMEDIGARPAVVIIDGQPVFEVVDNIETERQNSGKIRVDDSSSSADICEYLRASDGNDFRVLLSNLSNIHWNETVHLTNGEMLLEFGGLPVEKLDQNTIRVQSVRILCYGPADGDCSKNNTFDSILNLEGGCFMPSPIAISTLGLVEISQEAISRAGSPSPGIFDPLALDGNADAVDGLEVGISYDLIADGGYNKLLELASRNGISQSIVVPEPPSHGLIMGKSVLIRTNTDPGSKFGIVKSPVGLHVAVGKRFKNNNSLLGGVHGQLLYLKTAFLRAARELKQTNNENITALPARSTNTFLSVIQGDLPLILHSNNADQIASVLRLKSEIEDIVKRTRPTAKHLKLIIIGAAEAWLVAKSLKQHNVQGIVLKPVNCLPEDFDSRRCRSLSSLENPYLLKHTDHDRVAPQTGIGILLEHNLTVAIAPDSDEMVRDLYFDAGWAKWMSGRTVDGSRLKQEISMHNAVGMITWDIRKMFDLSSPTDDFVVFHGAHPLEKTVAKLELAVMQKSANTFDVRCRPKQL